MLARAMAGIEMLLFLVEGFTAFVSPSGPSGAAGEGR